jgi:3D (Asp-Asp-Asp) domain-containing protein
MGIDDAHRRGFRVPPSVRSASPLARRARAAGRLASALGVAASLVAVGLATGRSASSASSPDRDVEDAAGSEPDMQVHGTGPLVELPSEPSSQAAAAPPARDSIAGEVLREAAGEARLFDGRPLRLVRTIRMRVTAYSPDERSCGASADGITASGYSVYTNGGALVAADPKVLPLGSIVRVPGYDGGSCVPVLDVGGAIKGARLDVLFPTHEEAMAWGVRDLEVEVWDFDDGRPSGFRRMRRSH